MKQFIKIDNLILKTNSILSINYAYQSIHIELGNGKNICVYARSAKEAKSTVNRIAKELGIEIIEDEE